MEFNEDLPALPKGWVWTRVGEIMEVVRGASPRPKGDPRYFGGNIPWIMISDISKEKGKYISKTKDTVTEVGAAKSRYLKAGTLILSNSGTVCVPKILAVNGCIHDGFVAFPEVSDEIEILYFYYFFEYVQPKIIQQNKQGVTQVNLNTNIVRNIDILLPPLAEQHRIVNKIEELFTKLDAGVDALKKIKIQLKRYRQAVLKYAFEGKLTQQWREAHKEELEPASVLLEKIKEQRKKESKEKFKELPPIDTSELPELPEGWVWVKIIDLLGEDGIFIDGDWVETKDQDPNGDVRLIQLADIGDGFYRNRSNRFLTIDKAIQLNCTFLQPNDVLIARMPDPLGRACIFPGDSKPCVTVVDVCIIRPNLRISNKRWLMHMINAVQFRSGIEKLQSGSTRKRISRNNLSKLFLPLSPLPEQHQIVAEIESRLSVADQLEKVVEQSLKQAERLRQSILKKAFEGKLVPQDPTDEPAEKLLERIKEEKENRSLIKQKSRKRK